MKKLTAHLIDKHLLWAVALAEGFKPYVHTVVTIIKMEGVKPLELTTYTVAAHTRQLTELGWSFCGNIIDREIASIYCDEKLLTVRARHKSIDKPVYGDGNSIIIACMRCYVTARFGKEVDIPEQLL